MSSGTHSALWRLFWRHSVSTSPAVYFTPLVEELHCLKLVAILLPSLLLLFCLLALYGRKTHNRRSLLLGDNSRSWQPKDNKLTIAIQLLGTMFTELLLHGDKSGVCTSKNFSVVLRLFFSHVVMLLCSDLQWLLWLCGAGWVSISKSGLQVGSSAS